MQSKPSPARAGVSICACCAARDRQLYCHLAYQLGLPPTSFILLHMGAAAADLFQRRAPDAAAWRSFRQDVSDHHPDIPAWTSCTAADGQLLASVPERAFYETLLTLLPPTIKLTIHPVIDPAIGKWCADFGLVRGYSRMVHVEVAGLVATNLAPRNAREGYYIQDLSAKLEAYAAAGLPAPFVIHIDDICDRARLRAAIARLLTTSTLKGS